MNGLLTMDFILVILKSGKIAFWMMVIIVGISYGALIANIPAQVLYEYGHENFGRVYPVVFIVHGLTALFASPLAGFIYDKYGTYRPAMAISSGISFLCFVGFFAAYRKINNQIELSEV